MNGLVMLKEHVDDTEDLINIELDNRLAKLCYHSVLSLLVLIAIGVLRWLILRLGAASHKSLVALVQAQ